MKVVITRADRLGALRTATLCQVSGPAPTTSTLASGESDVGAGVRLIYDDATGALYYDSDGGSSANRVQFAQLGGDGYGIPQISASDFGVYPA